MANFFALRACLVLLVHMVPGQLEELEIDRATASSFTNGNEPRLAIDKDITTFFKSKEGPVDLDPYLRLYLRRPAEVASVKVVNKYQTITKYCKTEDTGCTVSLNRTEIRLYESDEDGSNSSICGTIYVNTDGYSAENQTYTVNCGKFVAKFVELRRKYLDDASRFFNIVEVSVNGTYLDGESKTLDY
ncbi:hypothetical protein ACHWQZ_G012670 [Mnemiopsis leidyi]